jgi:hypothetical protein
MKYLLILILFVSTLFSNTNNQSLFTQEDKNAKGIKINPSNGIFLTCTNRLTTKTTKKNIWIK